MNMLENNRFLFVNDRGIARIYQTDGTAEDLADAIRRDGCYVGSEFYDNPFYEDLGIETIDDLARHLVKFGEIYDERDDVRCITQYGAWLADAR